MKIKLNIEKEYDVKYLLVNAGVRYWEDATVNGVEDEAGDLIPCREGDRWCPLIDVDSGIIENWEQGKKAQIHYKVCDAGEYTLLTLGKEVIIQRDGYVVDAMCPQGGGDGDYIIMHVDENGKIKNWYPDFEDFEIN